MTETPGPPSREDAARRAAESAMDYYIVIPGSPWGGKTATFGPMDEVKARARLDEWLPRYMPECPPKLLRLIEDYAQEGPS
jgi:hypothetical protein